MRILVVHDVPAGHVGGMNRIMQFTHAPLAEHGHKVDYFCSERVVSGNLNRRFAFPWAVYRFVRNAWDCGLGYDIVNVHEPLSAFVSLLRNRAGGPRVVVTSHGSEHRSWQLAIAEAKLGRKGPSLRTRVLNPTTRLWQCKIGLRTADHVFCLNEEDRSFFSNTLGIARQKITHIVPGATREYLANEPSRLAREPRTIVFVAAWRKNKGIEDLVPAFAGISQQYPGTVLKVLGGGQHPREILSDFPPELRGHVRCVQTKSDEENARELANSDVFLLPSLFEGTPLSMIEAMASALPIVTTDTCGMKDVIQSGRNGILVPIRRPDAICDAVHKIFSNSELRIRLASEAQADAISKYTWGSSARTVLTAYEGLAKTPQVHNRVSYTTQ